MLISEHPEVVKARRRVKRTMAAEEEAWEGVPLVGVNRLEENMTAVGRAEARRAAAEDALAAVEAKAREEGASDG